MRKTRGPIDDYARSVANRASSSFRGQRSQSSRAHCPSQSPVRNRARRCREAAPTGRSDARRRCARSRTAGACTDPGRMQKATSRWTGYVRGHGADGRGWGGGLLARPPAVFAPGGRAGGIADGRRSQQTPSPYPLANPSRSPYSLHFATDNGQKARRVRQAALDARDVFAPARPRRVGFESTASSGDVHGKTAAAAAAAAKSAGVDGAKPVIADIARQTSAVVGRIATAAPSPIKRRTRTLIDTNHDRHERISTSTIAHLHNWNTFGEIFTVLSIDAHNSEQFIYKILSDLLARRCGRRCC